MAYRVEVGSKARAQLDELDATVGAAVERKIIWLAENAAAMIHRRLVGMPDDLAGLCKLRVGDWRILYCLSSGKSRPYISNSAPVGSVPGSLMRSWSVKGEQHYWVHPASVAAATFDAAGVTIDRFTGQVIDKQIEVVNE
jgi:mRNA-degrading endonuclease RelE of RelBE toxin-antitoxin system